ncbi:MAG TPA: alpha/beta fold hydrolase [Chloroflexota bacterium]|nr:alpha/beta fold hydrolase [Chloroflexota bacterium]
MTSSDSSEHSYTEHLVWAETADSLLLGGALIRPSGEPADSMTIVWIHGGMSNFYDPLYVAIGRALAARGYNFLTGNTRGHDACTLLWRGRDVVLAGSSFERFDEATRDISAWIEFAESRGAERLVLAGHSLGASKAACYLAWRDDPRVRGLVAASPIVRWPSYPERTALAEQLVSDGRGEDLLPPMAGSPRWNMASAQMLLTREQIIRHAFDSASETAAIADVRCPVLVLYGEDESVPGDWVQTIRDNARSTPRLDIAQVEGADHRYVEQRDAVGQLIASWAAALG